MDFSTDETMAQKSRRLIARSYRLTFLRSAHPRPFIMVTTSRSGSTWACDILARVLSCGNVPEHIRPDHVVAVRNGLAAPSELSAYFVTVLRDLRLGRVGGSKLIWDNMPDVIEGLSIEDQHRLYAAIVDLSPVLIRLRRKDIFSQAISRYLAQESGTYHQYKSGALKKLAAARTTPRHSHADRERIPYNFSRLKHHVEILRSADAHLDKFLQESPVRPLEVCYEQLLEHPEAELAPILQSLFRDSKANINWRQRLAKALERSKLVKDQNPHLDDWKLSLQHDFHLAGERALTT